MNTFSYYSEIKNRIERLASKEFSDLSVSGLIVSLVASIQLFTLLALLELFGRFSSGIRTMMVFFLLMIVLSLLLYFSLIPFLKYLKVLGRNNYYYYAGRIGEVFPALKDELLNALQLAEAERGKVVFSEELCDAAFEQVYLKTKDLNFLNVLDLKRTKRLFYFFLSTAFISALLIFVVPGLQESAFRLINYQKEFLPPAKFSFIISPGNKEITKGNPLLITAKIIGPVPGSVSIGIKYKEQTEFEFEELKSDSTGKYSFNIPAVRASFDYFIKAEDVNSKIYSVSVVDKPIIKSFVLTIIPPAYTMQKSSTQIDNGNVTAMAGTQLQFDITTTKENLKSAKLQFSDSTSFSLKLQGKRAFGNFRMMKDAEYKIIITDSEGNQNENPVSYSIKAVADQYPTIEMLLPNKNISLGSDDRLPLLVKVSDDFGFSKLLLHYRLSSSKFKPEEKSFSSIQILLDKNSKETEVNYIWNLSPLSLAVDDVVTYYLEIFDNDVVSGPKYARTGMFTIRVPSLDELFAEADKTQNEAEDKLTESLKDAQKLKEELQKINQDLKQDKKEITWQEKERIEKALDKFEQLEKKIDDIKQNLAEFEKEMQKNNLLSRETLEKYMELQKLFEEIGSEEMKKAAERLQEMLKNLNREQIQKAMENMQFNEDMMKKSIERTIQLLKRVQIEQKLDEIEKRLENLSKDLNELKNQTNKSNLSDEAQKNELADKQKEISSEMKNLEDKMKELKEKMEEFEDMPNNEMEKALSEMQKQQNDKLSEQAQKQIQSGQKQQAMQNQSQMSKNISTMQQMMNNLQQQMMMQNQRMVFNQMMKVLDNLLTLSKAQEELKNQSQKLDPNSSQFNENARKQNNLERNMDKIANQLNELSKKTFAVSPEMAKALGKARNSMRQATSALQNRSGSLAKNQQGQAMSALNEAAGMMKGAMENMMNAQGSGGGMMSLMQQLQQLGQQQMNLNNLTQMLNQGQMSLQQQAELQRLAQQQEMIRKSLEELNREAKEAGQSKKLPANLDKVLDEMREVVTDLSTQKLDDELVQKQERILSKLLDAQRSINERDFEKQRESVAGKEFNQKSPAELNLRTDKGKSRIKDELNKAVNEGYTKDYEALIKKYYEALEKIR